MPSHLQLLLSSTTHSMLDQFVQNAQEFAKPNPWAQEFAQAIDARILLCGASSSGQEWIAADLLSRFEGAKFYVQTLDVHVLLSLTELVF